MADTPPGSLPLLRSIAFKIAHGLPPEDQAEALEWLEGVMKALSPDTSLAQQPSAQALFSPGDAPLNRIVGLLGGSRDTVDICVFTVTDNRVSEAIAKAHRRGVNVRIVTDDDKSFDKGSDIAQLREGGVPVRTDRSPHHMHHKFALFDGDVLLSGSYNWTRSAANHNRENVIVTSDMRLVRPFRDLFEALWGELE